MLGNFGFFSTASLAAAPHVVVSLAREFLAVSSRTNSKNPPPRGERTARPARIKTGAWRRPTKPAEISIRGWGHRIVYVVDRARIRDGFCFWVSPGPKLCRRGSGEGVAVVVVDH